MADVRINPLNYPTIKCKCGCSAFIPGVILKRISGIALGTGGDDQIVDLPIYICNNCGEILEEYKKMYKLDEPSEEKKLSPLITNL